MGDAPGRHRRPPLAPRAVQILLAGLALREAFSFWTGQPFDLEVWVRTGHVVAGGMDPYRSFWPPVPGASFAYLSTDLTAAAYLPFWPALLGELTRAWLAIGGNDRFVLYFLLKQPGILADVGCSYLLYRLAEEWSGEAGPALAVMGFWSFFPYAIVISAIWGQFDAIVVLVLLGLLYARTGLERNVLYGLGIFVKWLTAIFLPLEIFRERGPRRAGVAVALALPAGLTLGVFLLEGWSFTGLVATAVSQTHGGVAGMNYASLITMPQVVVLFARIPEFYVVIPYLWVPAVIAAGGWATRWLAPASPSGELRAMLFVVSVFLLLRWGLYEQYLLYLFAPLALDVAVFHPGRRALLRWTWGLSMIWLLINNDLGLRFLSPISTGIEPFTTSLDSGGPWGLFRFYAFIPLALAVTVTLVQVARTVARDEPRPELWPRRLLIALRSLLVARGTS